MPAPAESHAGTMTLCHLLREGTSFFGGNTHHRGWQCWPWSRSIPIITSSAGHGPLGTTPQRRGLRHTVAMPGPPTPTKPPSRRGRGAQLDGHMRYDITSQYERPRHWPAPPTQSGSHSPAPRAAPAVHTTREGWPPPTAPVHIHSLLLPISASHPDCPAPLLLRMQALHTWHPSQRILQTSL